jgi:hypothetical protein
MRAAIKARNIRVAVQAVQALGLNPTRIDCHPDGRTVVWLGDESIPAEDMLEKELDAWRRSNGAN